MGAIKLVRVDYSMFSLLHRLLFTGLSRPFTPKEMRGKKGNLLKGFENKTVLKILKGQMMSDCIFEIIDFPKYHRKNLIVFCPESLFRLGVCYVLI